MFEQIEQKWTEDSVDYNDLTWYELEHKKITAHWTRELQQLLGSQPLRILEVGCGPAFMSILAARLGHEVKAIDGAAGMVEKAKKNIQKQKLNVEVCQEDGVTLPMEKKKSYDVILSRDVVWTLYNPEKAFRRWKEVLKPGGKIIYFDGDYQTLKPTWKNKIRLKISEVLIYITEKKKYDEDVKENSGIYEQLPLTSRKRPETDFEILKRVHFARIQIKENRWLNSPLHLDYWKYGYLGKKFIVVATKKKQEKCDAK